MPRQVSQHLELLGQLRRQLLADELLTRERRERLGRLPGSARGNIQVCGDLVRQPAHQQYDTVSSHELCVLPPLLCFEFGPAIVNKKWVLESIARNGDCKPAKLAMCV